MGRSVHRSTRRHRARPFARFPRVASALLAAAVAAAGGPALVAPAPLHALASPAGRDHAPDGPRGRWVRPVPGPVTEPFRAPNGPFGAGHRGADLAARPGEAVVAAGAGRVTFAGSVAGTLHVVVAHPGGLRTSYSFLSAVSVRRGDPVGMGAVVGRAGGAAGPGHIPGVLHLGLRVGERYVDPAALFGPPDLAALVHLAPVRGAGTARPPSAGAERHALARGLGLIAGAGRALAGGAGAATRAAGTALGAATGTLSALRDGAIALAGAVSGDLAGLGRRLAADAGAFVARAAALGRRAWDASALAAVTADLLTVGQRLVAWARSRGNCTLRPPPLDGTGGSGHTAMVVAGIGSRTGPDGRTVDLDPELLGYRSDEVHWYSYAADGGSYTPDDTGRDLVRAAIALGEQLRARQAAEPGREVDLIAHSQGGVVVDLFLARVYSAADPTYPPIGTVVTLASPHRGAPLATAIDRIRSTASGRAALEVLSRRAGGLPDPSSAAVADLSERSPAMRALAAAELPEHLDVTSIAAPDDVVVPATATAFPGGTNVTVDPAGFNDHSNITRDHRSLAAARLALEGRPPPCVGLVAGIRQAVEPVVITRVEHTLGRVGQAAGAVADATAAGARRLVPR